MKIQLLIGENGDGARCDGVDVDGKRITEIFPLYDCPEDATLERDMLNGDDVIRFIQLGYEAGKRGEPLEVLPSGKLEW